MKKTLSKMQWFGIAAAVLMLALFVMHFLPYWLYQGESVSIAGYVIRPYEYGTFTELFRSYFGKKYRITLLFGLPMVLTMVGCLAGSVLCTIKSSKALVYLVPIVSGACCLFGLLTGLPYALSGMRLPMIIVSALVLLCGCLGLVLALRAKKKPLAPSGDTV